VTIPAPASAATRPPASAGAAVTCKMSQLPLPAGMKDAKADAVDPTGRYIVGNNVVGQDFQPILWTDARAQALPMVGKSVQATAVNASGVVVGLVADAQQEYVFRFENGAYTKLHTPPGRWTVYPQPAVNAAGDVVINVEPFGNSGGKGSFAVLWKAGSATPIKLPLPAGANAHDITDDGTIVGTIYKDGEATAAYAWDQQGHGRKLQVPAGQTAAAYAARGKWATGGLWPSMAPALWNLETGALTRLGLQGSAAPGRGAGKSAALGPGEAVNAAGWVVTDRVVLRDGADVKLAVPSGQDARPAGVSDGGLVVGQALTNGRAEDLNLGPRVWSC